LPNSTIPDGKIPLNKMLSQLAAAGHAQLLLSMLFAGPLVAEI
jgi:hypothetical protein